MARVSLIVAGKAEFDRSFKRIGASFDNLMPIWDDVRDAFWKIQEEQFASEGGAGRSGKWKPLTKRYEAQKIKQYGAKPILERTGRMKKSLTGQTGDTVYEKNQKDMAIGTSVFYAKYNHATRPVISFSASQKNYLQKQIQKALIRELRRGGIYAE